MHTPTPYRFSDRNWRNKQQPFDRYIVGNIGECFDDDDEPEEWDDPRFTATSVAIVPGNATSGTITDDTAAFICLACNSFDAMVEALESAKAFGSQGETHDGISVSYLIDKALAKARQQPGDSP